MAKTHKIQGIHPNGPMYLNARRIAIFRIAEMYTFVPHIHDPARAEELHNMRIAAKRLRYTLEIFQVCFGQDIDERIEDVKSVQEQIGQIHDCDVLIDLVRSHLAVLAQREYEHLVAVAGKEAPQDARMAEVRKAINAYVEADPRLGLLSLLGRKVDERNKRYADFITWWDAQERKGFRSKLFACITAEPPSNTESAEEPAGKLMRVAAFSDTHGNLLGTEAVLADIQRQAPFDHIVMGGDLVAGGPQPAETLARIVALGCPVVLGNTDFYLFADAEALDRAGLKPKERAMNDWTTQRIGPDGIQYLRALPFSVQLPGPDGGIRLVHANHRDLEEAIEPDEDETALQKRLAGVDEPVLLFGHLHISYQRRLGQRLLVDIASAGFPRDGDHRAAWAEIRHDGGAWQALLHRVPYDFEAVAEQLRVSDMPNAEKRRKVLLEARYGKRK